MCATAVWCAVHSGWQNGGKLSAPVAGRSPVEEPGRGNAGGPAGAEPFRAEKGRAGLRQAFSADLYGAGETTLPAAVVEALERHDKLLICADAAAGALLEARFENLPGAEKVFDFGAVSYANPKTGPLIEKRAVPACPKTAPTRSGRRWPGLRLPAAWWGQISLPPVPSGKVTVCWCSAAGRAAFCAPSRRGRTPLSGCWISSGARRQTSLRAEGTGFLPARRAAKKDVLPSPQPKRHPLRRVCMTLLVLALLAALTAVGAWKYTNGNFYALPEQLRALLTEHVPRPGATLV